MDLAGDLTLNTGVAPSILNSENTTVKMHIL
jgi:hypothetical protein